MVPVIPFFQLLLASIGSPEVCNPFSRLDGQILVPSQVNAIVVDLMKRGHVPGLSLAILNSSKPVYVKGFGVRDVEKGLPMTTDTIMYGASFTKSVFSVMFMQLVDENVIKLDVPVALQLPKSISNYPDHEDLASDPLFARVTPRMLLSHTSGLPNVRWYRQDGTLDENAKLKIEFEPGSRYAYSGEGINLLGTLAAAITGKSVGNLMQERIFTPFGMSRTSMTWQPKFEDETATGYTEDGKSVGHNRQKRPRAAGSMDTSISDYALFMSGAMSGKSLSWSACQAIFSPQIRIRSKTQFPTFSPEYAEQNANIQLSYGLGWGLFKSPYGKAFFKGGHLEGWENYCVAFPEKGIAFVVMTNSANGDSIFTELLEKLIGDKFSPSEWEEFVPVKG